MPGIVMLTTNLAQGGAEAQVFRLSLDLKRRGWDVAVVSLLPPGGLAFEWTVGRRKRLPHNGDCGTRLEPVSGPFPQPARSYAGALEEAGVPVFSLDMRPGTPDPRGFLRLAALLKRLRPLVLHSHMFHANLLARLARMVCPVPVVISTLHSAAESARGGSSTRTRDWLYRLTDPMATAVVAVSRAAAERHASCGAVRREKLRAIPNGVDTAVFRPDPERRARVRRELGLASEFVWLAAGRLMWKKDYPTLLRAFAARPASTLLIAGQGPLEPSRAP